jgi:hypothetical protein
MRIEGTWAVEGSVFLQTRVSRMVSVDTWVHIESKDSPELIAAVLRNAGNGCHAEQALREPTPINEQLIVNGEAFTLDDYPATRVRRQRPQDPVS